MASHTIVFKPASRVYALAVTTTQRAAIQIVPTNGNELNQWLQLTNISSPIATVLVQIRNAAGLIVAQAFPSDGQTYDGVIVPPNTYPVVVPASVSGCFITAIGSGNATLYAQLLTNQ